MGFQIGNIGYIQSAGEQMISKSVGINKPFLTTNQKTQIESIVKKASGYKSNSGVGNANDTDQFNGSNNRNIEIAFKWKQADLVTMAASGLFGLPGMLYGLYAGSQQGTPEQSKTKFSGYDVNELNALLGFGTGGGATAADPVQDAFKSLSGGLSIAGAAIPLMIVVMMLTQVKGLIS